MLKCWAIKIMKDNSYVWKILCFQKHIFLVKGCSDVKKGREKIKINKHGIIHKQVSQEREGWTNRQSK